MLDVQRSTFPKGRGFTLIELLVAMAITSIIMVTLFSLVGQSTTSYTQTQRAVNAVSQARAFMQFFDRELSTRLPGTPLIHMAATPYDRIAFVRVLTGDEQAAFENPPSSATADPGDLGTCAYYVDFSPDIGNTESPKLFRKILGPKTTQESFLVTTGTPPFPPADPTTDEPIIHNILGFEARPQYRDPADGQLKDWTATTTEPPSLIMLEIRFIDDSSAQRYKTRAEWTRLSSAPRDNELQLIRTFTRNITIAK